MQSSNFTNLVDTLNLSKATKVDGLGRTFQQGTILDPATTRAVPCGAHRSITGLPTDCSARQHAERSEWCTCRSHIEWRRKIRRSSAIPISRSWDQPAGCPSLAGTLNWVSTVAGGPVPIPLLQSASGRPHRSECRQAAAALQDISPTIMLVSIRRRDSTPPYQQLRQQLLRAPAAADQHRSNTMLGSTTLQRQGLRLPDLEPLQPDPAASSPVCRALLRAEAALHSGPPTQTYMVVLTETHVFNPHLVNEARLSDEHNWNTRMDPG